MTDISHMGSYKATYFVNASRQLKAKQGLSSVLGSWPRNSCLLIKHI